MRQETLLIGLIVLGTAACSPYLHSPPARMVPLEAAKALPKGDVALQGALAGGAAIWGPSVGAGTLQGRYGFGQGFEGSAEAGFAVLGQRDTEWNTNASHALFAARVGFKYEAVSWFAVQAGFGGGTSAAGGYISPDAGLIFSYQGEKLVPFLGLGYFYSLPLSANEIVFVGDGDVEGLYPDRTNGAFANIGIRIPLTRSSGDSPRTALMIAYRLVAAVHEESYGGTSDSYRETDIYNLAVFGVDFVLRKNHAPSSSGRRWELR